MNYDEFQHLARLYVVGALDEDEMDLFCEGRLLFGDQAEDFIGECRKLNAMFALSLCPLNPHPSTKQKLLARIGDSPTANRGVRRFRSNRHGGITCSKTPTNARFLGRN